MASDDHQYLGCYCSRRSFQAQAADALCGIHVRKQSMATFWTLFSSFLVVSINYAIQRALEVMTTYEKAHSLDRQRLEVCLQTFILKFINTGVVILLLNSQEVQHLLGLYITANGNFTREFFYTTGASCMYNHEWGMDVGTVDVSAQAFLNLTTTTTILSTTPHSIQASRCSLSCS